MKRMRCVVISFFSLIIAASFAIGTPSHASLAKPDKEAKRRAFLEAAMASIPKEGDDKTLSPYFFVMSDDPQTDRLPLKSTRADVDIAGVIADVKVTQVYKNTGRNTLEAIYIFPASTRAAVYAMRMTIGKRIIEAEIKEKEQARKDYEQARKEGKTASLLEQHRPNVFQMNVANILPGDEIKVEMKYTELLVPTDNVYEFVYPTVVGPRYSNVPKEKAPASEKWVETPYLHEGKKAPYAFGLDVNLNAGMPIASLVSPSHSVTKEFDGKTKAHVKLASGEGGNRDFVLRYSLAGGTIQSGLLLYQGAKENFFLMMMEPPARVKPTQVVKREYIFIIDVSGSMNGFPIDVTKELMKSLFKHLKPTDYFNVLLFAGDNAVLAEKSLPATPENLKKAIEVIEKQEGGGGTELMPALKRGLALPRTKGTSRIAVIVTDGYVSVEKDAFEYIRGHLGEANLFSFGIGSSVNRYIVEGMAHAGMGEPFVILNEKEAKPKAEKFRKYIQSPVLTDIGVAYKGFKAYDVQPKFAPDLFAQRPLIVFGKYKGDPGGTIEVTGKTAGGKFAKSIAVTPALLSKQNNALRYLWAREKIRYLADLNKLDKKDERVKEITKLGLAYSLLTDYTSFVAVDKKVRADGKVVTVKQPLPLPQGVSDYAVGGRAGSGRFRGVMKMAAPMAAQEAADLAAPPPPRPTPPISPPVLKGQAKVDKVSVVSGQDTNLTAALITSRIKRRMLTACYMNELGKDPKLGGSITVQITIDKNGKVVAAKLIGNTTKSASLASCVLGKIKAIVFAAPAASTRVVATVVMSFAPPGS